ncbi:MAG TPA: carboxypeptidase-like regulatory domain-containing protein [Terriglobia bacterium]|nr:carboxypeptidase-like regulatory domain-containing protein [Terriglobia bacterium]
MLRKTLVALCLLSLFSLGAFAQSTVGTLTGVVTDTSSAVLPGVTVKILNADTGQGQSILTNDAGSYTFILAPGNNYTLTAEFTGFKKVSVTKIALRMADTSTVNVTMEVGEFSQTVEVNAGLADPLLKDPTIGITLGETEIMGLPNPTNDPLALITTLPGYRASPLGHEYDTVGGLPMTMINTVRDGLSVTDGFSPGGVGSTTILNSDMIAEIRLILFPRGCRSRTRQWSGSDHHEVGHEQVPVEHQLQPAPECAQFAGLQSEPDQAALHGDLPVHRQRWWAHPQEQDVLFCELGPPDQLPETIHPARNMRQFYYLRERGIYRSACADRLGEKWRLQVLRWMEPDIGRQRNQHDGANPLDSRG